MLWKTFKFSSIKQAIFENAQAEHDLKPMKIIKAAMTRWLTHGESCTKIISRFEPLIDALDVIYFEKKKVEAKGFRDLWLDPGVHVASFIRSSGTNKYIIKVLQTSTLFCCSVTEKINRLLE